MVLFTKTYGRILAPGLAQLDPHLPPDLAARSPLATAWRRLDHALGDYISSQIGSRKPDLFVNFIWSKWN